MGYKRIQAVPNMMIDFDAVKLLKYVPDAEYNKVWRIVTGYFEQARVRNADGVHADIPADLSEPAKDAVQMMIDSMNEGITGYWSMCKKLAQNRNTNSRQVVDNRATNSRQVVEQSTATDSPAVDYMSTSSQPVVDIIKKEIEKESNTKKENKDKSLFGTFSQKNTTTEGTPQKSPDITPDILRLLMNSGFDMNAFDSLAISKIDGMVRDGTLTVETAKEAIERCKTENEVNLQYFFFMLS